MELFFYIFYIFYFLLNKNEKCETESLLNSARYALLYHFYLLILTYSNELVSDLSFPLPVYSIYENLFISTAFVFYYIVGINKVHKAMTVGCPFWELIIPFSIMIPYFFSPGLHILYFTISMGLYGAWTVFNKEQILFLFNKFRSNDAIQIVIICLLGLFFRLWYAYPYAAFDLVGYSADGPVYFKSALAFSKGNWGDVNFWHAPFYSLYISVFISLFGESSAVVFYSQAFIGTLTPVLIFLIARKLKLQQAAFIAGLLVAISHLCIHYSVVINRATPLTVTLPLLIYSLLCLRETFTPIKYFLLGILFSATFYFGQESLPLLAIFGIYLVRYLSKTYTSLKQKIYPTLLVGIGMVVIFSSLNVIYHSYTDQWLPLGRASDPTHASSLWNYNKNSFAEEMISMDFDPFSSPAKSSIVFLENPFQITQLLLGKLFLEIPDFLLDPGGLFLMPLHLSFESFHSANIQFYIYLFVIVGLAVFAFNKSIATKHKLLILGPIFAQIIFCSLLHGTFRFRAPITPLNMILLACAMEWLFFRRLFLQSDALYSVQLKMPLLFKN